MERKTSGEAVPGSPKDRKEDRLPGTWQNKKREPKPVPFKKIGGDLLFHEQAQYHRRCGA